MRIAGGSEFEKHSYFTQRMGLMTARIGPVLSSYDAQAIAGELEDEPHQREVAARLDRLINDLRRDKGSVISRMFAKSLPPPQGIYIHGAVGRGKTMLMDLFFDEVPFEPKRRAHFHEFMADVHERIGKARNAAPGDPIPIVARDLAKEAQLLCFDELHVTDIADAMILGRLFEGLFSAGCVMVATSNAHPSQLYRNGLNRQLFLPFIAMLEARMDVIELAAAKDFRHDKLAGMPLYFTPVDAGACGALDAHWARLTGGHAGRSVTLDVKGRTITVPIASMGVARFDFADLCDVPLGANDYLHIAHKFHTVIVDGIPIIDSARRDVARRFINLIDTLYDCGTCLIASAEAEPHALYPRGGGGDHFERTASRLIEMRSDAYLARHSPATQSR